MSTGVPRRPVRILGAPDALAGILDVAGLEIVAGTLSPAGAGRQVAFGFATNDAVAALRLRGLTVEWIAPDEEQPWERAEALRQPPMSLVRITGPDEVVDGLRAVPGLRLYDHGARRVAGGRRVDALATDAAIVAARARGAEVEIVETAAAREARQRRIAEQLGGPEEPGR